MGPRLPAGCATGPAPRAGQRCLLVAVLAGGVVLGLPATAGQAAAAAEVRTVSDAQLPVCSTTPSPSGVCKSFNNAPTGTASMVDVGPSSYLRLSTPDDDAHPTVFSSAMAGMPLDAIAVLSYDTLIEIPGTADDQQAPSIIIAVNPGEGSATNATLVWEPAHSGRPVEVGRWQRWTPTGTPSGSGGWWSTRAGPLAPGAPNKWGFATYTASFGEVREALPAATIVAVGIDQGSGTAGLQAGVDRLTINDTVVDFENPVTPTTITPVSGGGQSTVAPAPFAQPLATRLTGRDGTAPAAGTTVTFTVTGGSASFPSGATATATTGTDGVATSPALTAGPAPGPVTVTAAGGALSTAFPLTVRPPPGPPVADLAVTVDGVPATAAPGTAFTATITVRNLSSFPATWLSTGASAPTGLRIIATPGSIPTRAAAAFLTPSLAPGAELTHRVSFAVEAGAREARTIPVATRCGVPDPDMQNNAMLSTVTVG